jgi:hypothetical protein
MKVFVNERMLVSGEEWVPSSPQELHSNIHNLLPTLHCFNFFHETEVLFHGEGINSLIQNLELVDDDYFLFSEISQLRTILFDLDAIDWSANKNQRNDHLYFIILDGGATSYPANDSTLGEAAEYNFLGNEVLIINLQSSEINSLPTLYVNRVNVNPPGNMNLLQLEKVVEKEETIQHLLDKRKQPEFSWNPKHGENGRGMIPNGNEVVSPLLCNKEEAATILLLSVNSNKTDELYGYDRNHNKFIVFKDEYTLKNTFHPYHPINQDDVPDDVKKFILASSVLNPEA